MSIEMQRLILKEILCELKNLDRIINDDCCVVNKETEVKLFKIHRLLTEDE